MIAEGEVQQLCSVRNPAITEIEYMEIISRKTAMLFQAAAHSGAVLAEADTRTEEALRDYGLHLGIAFQLIDDQLDYLGNAAKLGKNVGDDLAEGKVTLPLIAAMRSGSPAEKSFIEHAIREGGVENLPEMVNLVKKTGALDYTANKADAERCEASERLSDIPESEFKQAMSLLVNFVVDRQH